MGMRGKNENLEAKAELAFQGAGECDLYTDGGLPSGNVLSMDGAVFDLLLAAVGGFDGDEGVSGNNGNKPTGTRFSNCVGFGRKLGLNCG